MPPLPLPQLLLLLLLPLLIMMMMVLNMMSCHYQIHYSSCCLLRILFVLLCFTTLPHTV
jgi:hypothetical protein